MLIFEDFLHFVTLQFCVIFHCMAMDWTTGRWTAIVERIHSGDGAGIEELYAGVQAVVRGKTLANLSRMTHESCPDDNVHEVLLVVLQAIRYGQLRDPEKLPGFIQTVARRQIVAALRRAAANRRLASRNAPSWADSPEARLTNREKAERLRAALADLSRRDREILERFYFKEQPPEQICGEMNLTGTQFRLYKSRAIAKCSNFVVSRPVPAGLRIA